MIFVLSYLVNHSSIMLMLRGLFHFSKFTKQNYATETPHEDLTVSLPFIVVPHTDALEQYFLEHKNDLNMNERNEVDEIFCRKEPILKHNLLVKLLGYPSPPKGD